MDKMNNMLSFIRGKIQKIQVDSPTKKCKNLSPYQQIYLDQINNYIQAGGGYTVLKQKLFQDINNNYMHQSPLVQEMVIMLRKGLETKEKEKQRRSITVIEDLISNCGRVMNQAFNQKSFCQVLATCAVYLRKLRSSDRDELRQRACGIFLYWNIKFRQQPNYLYNLYYQKLRRQQAQFPTIPYIKDQQQTQPQQKQNLPQITKQEVQNIGTIITDCQETVKTTKLYLAQYPEKIDTNFVRLLKAKTKKIYAISTSNQQAGLNQKDKERLSKVYKEIRTQLKEIDKINEVAAREKALQKEKDFLKEKMEVITPKASQKQIPKLQTTPVKVQKTLIENQPAFAKKSSSKKQPQPELVAQIRSSGKKSSHTQKSIIPENNLLDIIQIPVSVPAPIQQTPQKKTSSISGGSNKNLIDEEQQGEETQLPAQKFSTPKKIQKVSSHASQDLLDIDEDLAKDVSNSKKSSKAESNTSLHERFEKQDFLQVEMKTPPKNNKGGNYEKLLDFQADNSASPAVEQKKLDFKQLYSANQLSPELKDLDLIGSTQKMKSKQSLKSSEDQKEFGQFV